MTPSKVIKQIYRISRIGSWMFIISLVGVIINGLVNFSFSLLIGLFSEIGIRQASQQVFQFSEFKPMVIIFIITAPLTLLAQGLNLYGGLNSEKKLKDKIIDKVVHQSNSSIKASHSGDAMTLITSDASVIDNYYFQALNYMLVSPLIGGIAGLITTIIIDYRFAIISVVIGIASVLVSYVYTDKLQKAHQVTREKDQISITQASEIISNETMIRHYGQEDYYLSTYDESNEVFEDVSVQTAMIGHKIAMCQAIINVISMVSFLGLGFYLSQTQGFDFTKVMFLLPLKSTISYMFTSLGTSWAYLIEVASSADRILNLLDSDSEDMRSDKPELEKLNQEPFISFKDVDFSYDSKVVLKDLSFDINTGQSVGFVGSSGSGKSTVFSLLMGLYQDYGGAIRIHDLNVKDYSLGSIRDHIVVVEQDAPLFNRTIFENIALGAKNPEQAQLKKVMEVCKTAGIHDFIMSLKDGYDTSVGEAGSNISGGQRQRIAIARALISEAPILILDEPTASLDSESERLIQETLNRIKKEKTILISAHRLSTVKDLDRLFVLNEGKIVETGSHDELASQKGFYAELLSQQGGNI